MGPVQEKVTPMNNAHVATANMVMPVPYAATCGLGRKR